MEQKTINKILNETEAGYDMMSQKFSQTRKFFWRGLEFIGDYAKDGDKILDFGCGNGRLLELLLPKVKPSEYVGVDTSQKLIDIAKSKYSSEVIKFQKIATSENLPLENNYFNIIYSIAVFHHFPKEHAKKMAQELHRVIKPEGYIIITVWYLWPVRSSQFGSPKLGEAGEAGRRGKQKNYMKNILKNWTSKLMGESELGWNDCYISFKNNEGKIFQRYHHAYTKKELKKIFSDAGFAIEKCEVMNKRNIILIGRRAGNSKA